MMLKLNRSIRQNSFFIDPKSNWCEHALYVKKTISPKLVFNRKLKHIVSLDCLIKYYMATV